MSEFCDGFRQSPINIVTEGVQKMSSGVPLILTNGELKSSVLDLSNSGHGATFKLLFNEERRIAMMGGPLYEPYILDAFHLHWDSEHTVDGKRYDAELHMVHFNAKYGSVAEAVSHPDGLAVLGFFLEEAQVCTRENRFISLVNKVRNPGEMFLDLEPTDMISINEIIGDEPIHVWNYPGSLTTPGCNEVVTWLVAKRSLKITEYELRELRKIRFADGERITENYRPIQELNGRKVLEY